MNSTDRLASWHRIVAAVPVVLVNAVAFAGQLAFLRARLPWPLAGQVTVALALESIAIYLAWHAHVAQLANDPSLRLRLSSYAVALVIAAMNYSHYAAPGWRPTFPALAVGLMSAVSPWLWSVHSRRVSRDRLMAAGLVEPHALRLGATRWAWHPLRSARVMWHATWAGVADPREAISRWGGTHHETVTGDAPGNISEKYVSGSPGAPAGSTAAALPDAPAAVSERTRQAQRPRTAHRASKRTGDAPDPRTEFASEMAAGTLPSLRLIMKRMHVGADRATTIRAQLESSSEDAPGDPEPERVPHLTRVQ